MAINKNSLTEGRIQSALLRFAFPMILGNMLQQIYNIVDSLIVGKYIGAHALAAVGSTYTLMTFLTSIIIGLCMGSGSLYSFDFGRKDLKELRHDLWQSFVFIFAVTLLLMFIIFPGCQMILRFMRVPSELMEMTVQYCLTIFCGVIFIFLFNFFAYAARSMGNSMIPLVFLGCSSVLNIGLDLLLVLKIPMGIRGAALATVISQAVSGIGLSIYFLITVPYLRPDRKELVLDGKRLRRIAKNDIGTCLQQSVMNFGILMIQGLVNSFGPVIMAAFTVAVKIDTLAYMPAQEYGNAYSLFISQNKGADHEDRIRTGTRWAMLTSGLFSIAVSIVVVLTAKTLMMCFVQPTETEIIRCGIHYLRIEGACYLGIGILFLLYGYYRGIGRPFVSLILTIVSLGTRVVLAYSLAPNTSLGVTAIWMAIPIGWFLADATGLIYMRYLNRRRLN